MVPSSSKDVTRVESPSNFLEITRGEWREMAGSPFTWFGFQKPFHSTDVFCAPSLLSAWLGFRLLCASLFVCSLFYRSFGFTEFKISELKDVYAKTFQSIKFFKMLTAVKK